VRRIAGNVAKLPELLRCLISHKPIRACGVNPLPNPSRPTKIIFFTITLLIVFVSVEMTAQILYRIRYGHFVWREVTEIFDSRSFTRVVTDSRHVTIIPNFSNPKYEFGISTNVGISTDAYGFRRGAQTTNPVCPNVVFIGDSVPFGWGVPDHASMPSKLFEHLRNAGDPRCVINAAIPSYSLFQAVARFEYEILGKFKIDSVYLQIYEPVWQFLRFGAKWRPDMDSTTVPSYILVQKPEYIASIAIARNALIHFGVLARYDNFNSADRHSLDMYRLEIRRKLEHLHDLIVQANVKQLIVAPVTVPSGAYQQLREEHRIAIEAINDQLRQFARRHEDTTFLDMIGLLKSYPDAAMFVDKCCHLTERGNDLVARELIKILTRK